MITIPTFVHTFHLLVNKSNEPKWAFSHTKTHHFIVLCSCSCLFHLKCKERFLSSCSFVLASDFWPNSLKALKETKNEGKKTTKKR